LVLLGLRTESALMEWTIPGRSAENKLILQMAANSFFEKKPPLFTALPQRTALGW
jgi:hypothetical protein